ncbi:unnamed protein product [Calypogeia fissa]
MQTISLADLISFPETSRRPSFPFATPLRANSVSTALASYEVERIISDGRINEIERLDRLIGDASRLLYSPHKCLEDAYTLFTLLEAENITNARVASLYYDAFQIVICCGDLARAKVFAERAYDVRLYCGGNDNPVTAHMKSLIANPAQHRLFGVSKIWQQSVKTIPRRLEGDKFEAWL